MCWHPAQLLLPCRSLVRLHPNNWCSPDSTYRTLSALVLIPLVSIYLVRINRLWCPISMLWTFMWRRSWWGSPTTIIVPWCQITLFLRSWPVSGCLGRFGSIICHPSLFGSYQFPSQFGFGWGLVVVTLVGSIGFDIRHVGLKLGRRIAKKKSLSGSEFFLGWDDRVFIEDLITASDQFPVLWVP